MKHRSSTPAGRRRVLPALLGALLVVTLVLTSPSASARRSGVEKERFDCRETSSVKLKVVPRDSGVLEVTSVVFSQDDDVWDWRLKHNDDLSGKGTVKAKDSDRSFKVVRDMADYPGLDIIDFRAENTATGEVCRASLDY